MPPRDRYLSTGRKLRIVFSWDEGLGAIQRVEIDGKGRLTAVIVRVRGAPSKWTRRLAPQHLAELLDLFREVDFFSISERDAPREPQHRVRREIVLVIGGRVNRVCDGLPGPRFGTVVRPGRCLDRIYRVLEDLTFDALKEARVG